MHGEEVTLVASNDYQFCCGVLLSCETWADLGDSKGNVGLHGEKEHFPLLIWHKAEREILCYSLLVSCSVEGKLRQRDGPCAWTHSDFLRKGVP